MSSSKSGMNLATASIAAPTDAVSRDQAKSSPSLRIRAELRDTASRSCSMSGALPNVGQMRRTSSTGRPGTIIGAKWHGQRRALSDATRCGPTSDIMSGAGRLGSSRCVTFGMVERNASIDWMACMNLLRNLTMLGRLSDKLSGTDDKFRTFETILVTWR